MPSLPGVKPPSRKTQSTDELRTVYDGFFVTGLGAVSLTGEGGSSSEDTVSEITVADALLEPVAFTGDLGSGEVFLEGGWDSSDEAVEPAGDTDFELLDGSSRLRLSDSLSSADSALTFILYCFKRAFTSLSCSFLVESSSTMSSEADSGSEIVFTDQLEGRAGMVPIHPMTRNLFTVYY